MARNPSYENVRVGDQYVSSISNLKGHGWYFISTVVKMEQPSPRFKLRAGAEPVEVSKKTPARENPEDRVVYVDISTSSGSKVDSSKKMWVSDLLAGKI